jgi:hypothetical protein
MGRIWNYWKEFFFDFKVWWRYRKIAIKAEDLLTKNNMRVDWLGRIYTVVNMPEEIQRGVEQVQQGWVISQLGPMNGILTEIGVNDYAYPEISRIPDSTSYLIVLYPDIDTLNPWRIILNILALGLIGTLVWGGLIVAKHFGVDTMIADVWTSVNAQ